MKLKKLTTTTAALLGAAMVTHAQTQSPAQDAREVPAEAGQTTPETPGAARPAAEPDLPAVQTSTDKFKQRLEKWEDADMEKISKNDLPDQVSSALDRIAAGGEVGDELVSLKKDGETVYCAEINRDGQNETKVFLSEDGSVEMTKQDTSIEEVPAAVRATINQHTENQSPDEVYRVMADTQTAYTAKVKQDDDQVKLITVSSTGEHIHTMSKDKSAKMDE